MLLRKALLLLPFAGITLTRFYGYDLSPDPAVETPRETEICLYLKGLTWFKTKKELFFERCNFPTGCFVSL